MAFKYLCLPMKVLFKYPYGNKYKSECTNTHTQKEGQKILQLTTDLSWNFYGEYKIINYRYECKSFIIFCH